MTNLAQTVIQVNEMLAVNKIKNIGENLETLALFGAIAEAGRQLNQESPPSLRNIWMCFQASLTDGSECCEILLRLMTDGPLQDRDLFKPPITRTGHFQSYIRLFDETKLTRESDVLKCTNEQEVLAVTRQIIAERDELANMVTTNNRKIKWLTTASIPDLMNLVHGRGPESTKKNVVSFLSTMSPTESVCVIDQAGNIAPLVVRNNKLEAGQAPEWLNGMLVRKCGRTIAYGKSQLNSTVDRTSYRRKNFQDKKYQKVNQQRLKREAYSAKRNFRDATNSKTDGHRSYDRE